MRAEWISKRENTTRLERSDDQRKAMKRQVIFPSISQVIKINVKIRLHINKNNVNYRRLDVFTRRNISKTNKLKQISISL